MVTDDVDRSLIVQDATRKKDVFHAVSQGNADYKTWHRLLQDELLDEVNHAKVIDSLLLTTMAVLLLLLLSFFLYPVIISKLL